MFVTVLFYGASDEEGEIFGIVANAYEVCMWKETDAAIEPSASIMQIRLRSNETFEI